MAMRKEEKKATIKTIRFPVLRAFLLITFITSYLCLLYGREPRDRVPIPRNVARNDLVIQIGPTADDSPKKTLGKEIIVMRFLREHQSEAAVGIYDITVFRAIDQARARLRNADKDLETISNELSYKEDQAQLER
jgi:hypothetical protein